MRDPRSGVVCEGGGRGGRGLVIAISFMVGFRKIVRRVSSFYVGGT